MQKQHTILLFIVPILTLALGWQVGMRASLGEVQKLEERLNLLYAGETQSGTVVGDPEKEADISLLWGVWRLLQANYIDPTALTADTMVFGAVRGLVQSVGDPYTSFMTPKENQDFQDGLNGHLQGIGAEMGINKEGQVIVASPLKGSPAQRAGLLPQDIVIKVDDEEIASLSLQEVVSKIRGPAGTVVRLTILREGAPDLLTFTITREDITVPSTEYEVKSMAGGNVGLLTINQFGGETVEEVRNVLAQIKPNTLRGLIIDLRYNGGGYLDGAVDLTSMFLRSGLVVTVEGREGELQRHEVSGAPILENMPLAVIINQASASASEILAGALQDHHRAKIIGMKSFGKGTVQEVIDLPGGSSLRVTIARWKTPSGRDLSKEGVAPDIVVDRTQEEMTAGSDKQLDAAIAWLMEGKDMTTGDTEE